MNKLRIVIELELGNDACLTEDDINATLRRYTRHFAHENHKRPIKDLNGNTIGYIDTKYLEED
jgi:hypothetical protein